LLPCCAGKAEQAPDGLVVWVFPAWQVQGILTVFLGLCVLTGKLPPLRTACAPPPEHPFQFEDVAPCLSHEGNHRRGQVSVASSCRLTMGLTAPEQFKGHPLAHHFLYNETTVLAVIVMSIIGAVTVYFSLCAIRGVRRLENAACRLITLSVRRGPVGPCRWSQFW
jgi:hypothetical protein